MDSLIKSIAAALDAVEKEQLGASTNHGKRIAVLCANMGKLLGKSADEISSLTSCALLHDNALTEYIFASRIAGHYDPTMKKHCEYGQRNADMLKFNTNIKDFILYHHERADGKGPYHIKEGEGPIEAELIAAADSIDVINHLQTINQDKLGSIQNFIKQETGKSYGKTAADTLLEVLNYQMIESLKDDVIDETAAKILTPWELYLEDNIIFNLVGFITKIIDYKSLFTKQHSIQIANIAWHMGDYYNYEKEERLKLYLAAALHDLGKLKTPTAVLEKPDKLTDEEFTIIKDHVRITWELLKDIDGFQDIREWASNHHEKLNGTGYPFGKSACDLDFNSRLMACIDIYQAVSEERPYHPSRNQKSAFEILNKFADEGGIDKNIVNDLSKALVQYDDIDLPSPEIVNIKH